MPGKQKRKSLRRHSSCSANIFQSPIAIPQYVQKCSMQCAVDFLYPQIERRLEVCKRSFSSNEHLIYVDVLPVQKVLTPDAAIVAGVDVSSGGYVPSDSPDIVYNQKKYSLYRIEFFARSLHRRSSATGEMGHLPLEMVLYHRPFSSVGFPIVAVSIFCQPMQTYSPSQDFFAPLANLLSGLRSDALADAFRAFPNNIPRMASTRRHEASLPRDLKARTACQRASHDLHWSRGVVCYEEDTSVGGSPSSSSSEQAFEENAELTMPAEQRRALAEWREKRGKCFVVDLQHSAANDADAAALAQDAAQSDAERHARETAMAHVDPTMMLEPVDSSMPMTYYAKSVYRRAIMKTSWNPMRALPGRKAFFVYQGSLPYTVCHPSRLSSSAQPGGASASRKAASGFTGDVTWVILENTMPIHTDDFAVLQGALETFVGNSGDQYEVHPVMPATVDPRDASRRVLYNDGAYVAGDCAGGSGGGCGGRNDERPLHAHLSAGGDGGVLAFAAGSSSSSRGAVTGPDGEPLSLLEQRAARVLFMPSQTSVTLLLWLLIAVLIMAATHYLNTSRTAGGAPMAAFMGIWISLYFFSNKKLAISLAYSAIFALVILLLYTLMRAVDRARQNPARDQLLRTVLNVLMYILLAAILGCGMMVAYGVSAIDTSASRHHLFFYMDPQRPDELFVSRDGAAIAVRIGAPGDEFLYGKSSMYRVDFTGFEIRARKENDVASLREDITDALMGTPPVTSTDENEGSAATTTSAGEIKNVSNALKNISNPQRLLRIAVLAEYERLMRKTSREPWNCFLHAVMRHAKKGERYFTEGGAMAGQPLNWRTVDDIMAHQMPALRSYLQAAKIT